MATPRRIDGPFVTEVAGALVGQPLLTDLDPASQVTDATVDAGRPSLVHVVWRLHGVLRTYDVDVVEPTYEPTDPADVAFLIRWEIVEGVETGEWEL